jgi:hypothetical protein
MPLFDNSIYKKSIAGNGATGAISIPATVFFWNSQQKNIGVELDAFEFKQDHVICFTSDGAWNMHDLVYYFLKRFGSGKMYFTTWAISEIAMRQLYLYQKEGLITELYGLLDYRNTSRKPAELAFIEQNSTTIKLEKIHAKVTVLELERISISINSSANYTRNPRIERGDIFVSQTVVDFDKSWILNEINDGTADKTD